MINIKCINRGEAVELQLEIQGSAKDIGIEAAEIVTVMPKVLLEECEPGFHIMKDAIGKMSKEIEKEIVEKEGHDYDRKN